MTIFGHRIIIGYNTEKTLRYGVHKEHIFTAIGFWPLLIGIGKKGDKVEKETKTKN